MVFRAEKITLAAAPITIPEIAVPATIPEIREIPGTAPMEITTPERMTVMGLPVAGEVFSRDLETNR